MYCRLNLRRYVLFLLKMLHVVNPETLHLLATDVPLEPRNSRIAHVVEPGELALQRGRGRGDLVVLD